ncbi:hypothetical protein [Micromonospora coxensis]|uniref:Uncharacterized protein n=1 Tax=Micromonospora coxensis TaxID=356852 RepID=A0A1C5GM13_9ACTN|nr:hypothetical protein [Micromonospora coxensis]SCG34825.1 hypothetical protein GA0070614_0105 [Micromonospora coxensis]
MGLIHAWRMQRLVSDARTAFERGDLTFIAGFDIDTRRRVSMKQIRREIDLIINAVEPIGWECVSVEPFLASVKIDFLRQS